MGVVVEYFEKCIADCNLLKGKHHSYELCGPLHGHSNLYHITCEQRRGLKKIGALSSNQMVCTRYTNTKLQPLYSY